jgi:chromo domain-containing protein 1
MSGSGGSPRREIDLHGQEAGRLMSPAPRSSGSDLQQRWRHQSTRFSCASSIDALNLAPGRSLTSGAMSDNHRRRQSGSPRTPYVDAAKDDIDLASTDASDQDSEKEFEVEDILACEQRDGETKYLVSWTGYDMHSCTWEPLSNLSQELIDLCWAKKEAEIDKGERPVFDTGVFEKAKEDWAAGYPARHRRRNRKREALGLPTTRRSCDDDKGDEAASTDDSEAGSREKSSGDDSSSDEAVEDDRISGSPRQPNRGSVKSADAASQPKPKQTTFTGAARPTGSHSSKAAESLRTASQLATTAKAAVADVKSNNPSTKLRANVSSSSTGYQGTARGPSATTGPKLPAKSAANAKRTGGQSLSVRVASRTGVGSLGMMARKTVTSKGSGPSASGNVFLGGKTRKAKARLEDSAVNPKNEAKHFNKHRIARISEKRSRDKEDKAPDASVLRSTLFDISKGQQIIGRIASSKSGSGHLDAPKTCTTQEAEIISGDDIITPPVPMRPALKKQKTGNSDGRKKSVQFAEEEEELLFTSEPMTLDDPRDLEFPAAAVSELASLHDGQIIRPPTPPRGSVSALISTPGRGPAPPSTKLPIAGYRALRIQVNSSICFAFRETSRSINAVFHGVTSSDAEAGLTTFLEKGTMRFDHTCLAQIFLPQLERLLEKTSGSSVSSVESAGEVQVADREAAFIEAVASDIRADLIGLCYVASSRIIVLYPTKCDDWRIPNLEFDSPDPSEAALHYIALSNKMDLSSHLVSLQDFRRKAINELEMKMTDRALLLQRSLNWQYDRLVSAYMSEEDAQHHFILLFPEGKAQTTLPFVVRWVQACDPRCRIFLGHHPGAWTGFCSREKTKADIGVVVVHESLTSALRRFPGLQGLIFNDFCNIWSFSESLEASPALPSLTMETNLSIPGALGFQRLFPHRSTLMLTPSFLISEPRQTLRLLRWFQSNWSGTSDYKLVTASNIVDYLKTTALSAADERSALLQHSVNHVDELEKQAAERTLSSEDCEARFRAWVVAAELEELREQRAGRLAYSEENSPLIFADEAIDANDEQSLVNWFGLWSLMRMDQFRKFHVVGSDDQNPKEKGGFVGHTCCRIPRLIHRPVREGKAESGSQGNPTSAMLPKTRLGPRDAATMLRLHSQRFGDYTAGKLQSYLEALYRSVSTSRKWLLYGRPLSAAPCPSQPRPAGVRFDYFTLQEWWSFWQPWRTPGVNTFLGFFCTTKDASEFAQGPDRQSVPDSARTPWVVACRKVHSKQHEYELILWDPDAPERCPAGRQPTDRDLLPAQRLLVEFVSEAIPKREDQAVLDKVWLGGFQSIDAGTTASKMDLALGFVDAITQSMEGLRQYLPLPDHVLPQRGYRQVKAYREADAMSMSSKSQAPHGTEEEDDGMEVDLVGPEGETKVLFHPPIPPAGQNDAPSLCRNHFFDQVSAAVQRKREQGDTSGLMTFRFRPTLEWFEEQRAEGRALNHVNVAAWPAIFKACRIADRSQRQGDKEGRNSDRSDSGPARRDSQISPSS